MTESPGIGPVQGKLWGQTQSVFAWNGVSAHSIRVKAGGYCSKHSHQHRWNRFLVLRGRLLVRIWKDGSPDETVVSEGGVSDVPPGVRHQFEALEDVEAVEFYWTVCDDGDIDRHGTVGGMKE